MGSLAESLDKTCTRAGRKTLRNTLRYHMDVSTEMTILMTYSSNDIEWLINEERQVLGPVTSFKYNGAIVSDHGSGQELLLRIHKPLTL